MDIRHLRYFLALVEHGSVRAAAERLHISQPAVSRRLRDLETDIGVTLHRYTPRGLELTASGRAFHTVADETLKRLDSGVRRVRAIGEGRLGTLRLGFVDNATWDGRLGRVFERFRQAEPGVDIELEPMNTPAQERELLRGQIDGGFVYPFGELPEGIRYIELARYRVVLAWPWPERPAPVDLVEASKYAFVSFPRQAYPAYHDRLWRAVGEAGVTLEVVQSVTTEAAVLSLVSAGVGVALVNGANRYRPPQGIGFHELADLTLDLPLCFAYRPSSASPALLRFVEALAGA